MSRSSRATYLLAALVVSCPGMALAEPPAVAPSQEQVESARAPFHEARELHRQGKLNEAVARILDAYHLASTPVIACEAGKLLVEAGRLVEGRDILQEVPALPVSPRETEAGRAARREAAMLAQQLATRVAEVEIAGTPVGVDLLLDGKPMPLVDAAARQPADPGAHTLVVRSDGQVCRSIAMTLAEGDTRTINLHDIALPCSSAPAAADTSAPPEAASDGSFAQHAAPSSPAAAVPDGERTRGSEPSTGSAWRLAGAGLAAAGAVTIGIGLYVMLHAKGDYDSVSSACPPRGCSVDAFESRQKAHDSANTATVVMTVGAAAVAGGGVLWFVLGRSRRAADASSPRVGVGIASVSLLVPVQ